MLKPAAVSTVVSLVLGRASSFSAGISLTVELRCSEDEEGAAVGAGSCLEPPFFLPLFFLGFAPADDGLSAADAFALTGEKGVGAALAEGEEDGARPDGEEAEVINGVCFVSTEASSAEEEEGAG